MKHALYSYPSSRKKLNEIFFSAAEISIITHSSRVSPKGKFEESVRFQLEAYFYFIFIKRMKIRISYITMTPQKSNLQLQHSKFHFRKFRIILFRNIQTGLKAMSTLWEVVSLREQFENFKHNQLHTHPTKVHPLKTILTANRRLCYS